MHRLINLFIHYCYLIHLCFSFVCSYLLVCGLLFVYLYHVSEMCILYKCGYQWGTAEQCVPFLCFARVVYSSCVGGKGGKRCQIPHIHEFIYIKFIHRYQNLSSVVREKNQATDVSLHENLQGNITKIAYDQTERKYRLVSQITPWCYNIVRVLGFQTATLTN